MPMELPIYTSSSPTRISSTSVTPTPSTSPTIQELFDIATSPRHRLVPHRGGSNRRSNTARRTEPSSPLILPNSNLWRDDGLTSFPPYEMLPQRMMLSMPSPQSVLATPFCITITYAVSGGRFIPDSPCPNHILTSPFLMTSPYGLVIISQYVLSL